VREGDKILVVESCQEDWKSHSPIFGTAKQQGRSHSRKKNGKHWRESQHGKALAKIRFSSFSTTGGLEKNWGVTLACLWGLGLEKKGNAKKKLSRQAKKTASRESVLSGKGGLGGGRGEQSKDRGMGEKGDVHLGDRDNVK